jgi:hypothetical protein
MKQVKPSLRQGEAEDILRNTGGKSAPDPKVSVKALADNAVKYLGAE